MSSAKELWEDIRNGISEYAPMVAGAIGIVNPGAGAAVGVLAKVFGKEPTDIEGLAEAVKNATPEQKLALIAEGNRDKEALLAETNRHEEEMAAKEHADRQGARNRQIASEQATGHKDTNLYVLAWVIVAGFFILCGILTYHDVDQEVSPVVYMLYGSLAAGFGAVVQYFFGSSKGSSDKTALLAQGKPQ